MHKKCGFKAFLKLLELFKHQTNILVGTHILDHVPPPPPPLTSIMHMHVCKTKHMKTLPTTS